jgi:hypothetical protein
MTRTINMTPTWADLLPAMLAVIENGTPEGQTVIRAELARMAKAADWAREKAASAEPAAPAAQVLWIEKGIVTDPSAHPDYCPGFFVDGCDSDDPDAMQASDGQFPPFRVFHPASQNYIPGEYSTREAAQEIADLMNGNEDLTEWQISDGPAGARTMSADFLDLETALRAFPGALFRLA